MTTREWCEVNAGQYPTRMEAARAMARELGTTVESSKKATYRYQYLCSVECIPKAPKAPCINRKNPMADFRELHDPLIQQQKKDERISKKIQDFIDGPLLKNGWYYLNDVPREAGIPSNDWDRHKGQYAELYVEVTVSGSRKITFVHPEYVDEAREIAGRG